MKIQDYAGAKKQFVETVILISHTNTKSAKITKTRKRRPLYVKKKASPKTCEHQGIYLGLTLHFRSLLKLNSIVIRVMSVTNA